MSTDAAIALALKRSPSSCGSRSSATLERTLPSAILALPRMITKRQGRGRSKDEGLAPTFDWTANGGHRMRGRIADAPGGCKTPLSLHVTASLPLFPPPGMPSSYAHTLTASATGRSVKNKCVPDGFEGRKNSDGAREHCSVLACSRVAAASVRARTGEAQQLIYGIHSRHPDSTPRSSLGFRKCFSQAGTARETRLEPHPLCPPV